MPFKNNYRSSIPPRASKGPVYCVGWRAFVHWPKTAGCVDAVPVTDENGKLIDNDLADGQEVEIVSWRPRARASATYQIRRSSDGREGWVAGEQLRRLRQAPAIAPVAASARG